ncbi:MAG: hypothetical protein SRB2_00139 [Desulfobacteraceae bacterium Eth-SRB2]|nr:MAG: hypothetical protein SRB2_00139 [Desulfobacteraceae bacterium Eth-SRB2]
MENISKLATSIQKLISPFTEPIFSEFGNYIAEKIRFVRFQNSLKVLARAKDILQEKGLDTKSVDLKVLVPIIEGAALEEDDEMTEIWAKLLASASHDDNVITPFPRILSELSPKEAKILSYLYDQWSAVILIGDGQISEPTCEHLLDNFDFKSDKYGSEFELIINNLVRLRLIGLGGVQIKDIDSQNYAIQNYQQIVLTQFGWAFIRACQGPEADEKFK